MNTKEALNRLEQLTEHYLEELDHYDMEAADKEAFRNGMVARPNVHALGRRGTLHAAAERGGVPGAGPCLRTGCKREDGGRTGRI
ncbi:hypothetical protein LJK87_05630 [Paenibacillus sp. P25]|nr:hypothetical protein LJK87_05630 [Paenibacillus sp. P25]